MFWGLVLEPGKRYSTTVEKSFHVSKAVLDCLSVKNDVEILSVILETEGSESLLCNLCKQKGVLQESLDLNFMAGDRLTFECRGHGQVHLSGYLLPDEDDDLSGLMGDEEDESEEEEEETGLTGAPPKKEKRKSDMPPNNPSKKKKIVPDEDEGDSDEENESGMSGDDMEDEDLDDEEEGEDEDDDDDDEDEDESDEDDETVQEKQKNKTPNKQQAATPNKKTPITNGVTPKEQKSNKKTPGKGATPNANITPKHKQVMEGGVVVKEIRPGNGPVAKSGKTLEVYYIGKLKENGKVFDKQMKGEGFKFKLGKGEVIKGWDIGLQGMKVGEKRVLLCPPGVAYGPKGAPPKIPPNSTLNFEIELRKVL